MTPHQPSPPRLPAKKRFGQHFLEGPWVTKVIAAIDPKPGDFFVEIGPGRGALTLPLAARAAHVLACELDRDMADALEGSRHPAITVLRGDFVGMTADALSRAILATGVPYARLRIVGNLPYNVGTVMLATICALQREGLPIVDATVMLQREVADRLVAQPGTRDYGALTVLIGQWASVERLLAVPPGAFRPAPSVQSAVVRLTFPPPDTGTLASGAAGPADRPAPQRQRHFEVLVKALFGKRRKTLSNALRGIGGNDAAAVSAVLAEAGIDGQRRPETLTLVELVRLSDLTSQ